MQIQKSIAYEQGAAWNQDWFLRATGIGSDEGPGDDDEMDWEHIDNIRTDLLNYGYSEVDQIYDPGATAAQVSSAVDQGRGFYQLLRPRRSFRLVHYGFLILRCQRIDQ